MNIIDYIILGILFIFLLMGIYKGFVESILTLVSFVLSWVGSLTFSPILARYILERHPFVFDMLITFSEGALRIDSVIERSTDISQFSEGRLSELAEAAQFPYPFSRYLISNLHTEALEHLGTLAEYFNHTIALSILNMASFIIVYIVMWVIFSIIISVAKSVVGFPVLKRLDGIFGGVFGVFHGMVILNLLFLVIPAFLTIVPVVMIRELFNASLLSYLFIDMNIFTPFLSGKI